MEHVGKARPFICKDNQCGMREGGIEAIALCADLPLLIQFWQNRALLENKHLLFFVIFSEISAFFVNKPLFLEISICCPENPCHNCWNAAKSSYFGTTDIPWGQGVCQYCLKFVCQTVFSWPSYDNRPGLWKIFGKIFRLAG